MTNYAKHADELYGDSEVHQLLSLGARRQALDICTPREINVSRLLAWLLDPTEGHGLGDKALRSLLAEAGLADNVNNLTLSDQRFLSPTRVHNLALSSLIVETELNVFAGTRVGKATDEVVRKRDLLDIVAIDPNMQVCVAVENKYGASESATQLERYHDGLSKLFPKYTRIHIFLDKREDQPSHPHWLGVGYSWLSEFLREQEQNSSVALEVRRVLTEFREAVQHEDEETASVSLENRLITSVAARFELAIKSMWDVTQQEKKGLFLQRLAKLSADKSLEGQAKLALFQLYHRRPDTWDQCKDQTRFADFHKALREPFPDLLEDVKHVKAYYALAEWTRFIDPQYSEDFKYPIAVRVHALEKSYRVTTYMDLTHVRADRREALLKVAEEARKKAMRPSPRKNASRFDIYKSDLDKGKAKLEVLARLAEFQKLVSNIP